MCSQLPDDLTSLLFRLLACQLVNQREILKLLDPSREKVAEMLKINDNMITEFVPVITKLKQTSSSQRVPDPVSPVPDRTLAPRPELSGTSSPNNVDVTRAAVKREHSEVNTFANVSGKEEEGDQPPSHAPPAQMNVMDVARTVAVRKEK